MSERVQIRRVYEAPSPGEGKRILVDRIWPRGLTKEAAALDLWLKEVAPSTALRKWYGHEPDRWPEFRRRYLEELAGHPAEVAELLRLAEKGPVTLLYAAHDGAQSNAEVLREYLLRHVRKRS
jgi:uncharacterized protein YeaO (DUF488 family)